MNVRKHPSPFRKGLVRRTALSLALSTCFVGAALADTGGLRIT